MTKSRTVLMVILSLVLAACVAAAAVFGVALARASLSDGTEAAAGEARWFITSGGVSSFEAEVNVLEKLRPYYKSYEAYIFEIYESSQMEWSLLPDDPGIQTDDWEGMKDSSVDYTVRTREFFGVVATLENAGEVAAMVTVTDAEGATRKDGCLGGDDERYTDEEVAAHISFEVYCSDVGTAAMEDIGAETTGNALVKMTDEAEPSYDLAVGDKIYFYFLATWTTDLERDMFELDESGNFVTDSSGYKTLNENYDGTQGDEFDTWAGEHLTGITLSVRARAEQAE